MIKELVDFVYYNFFYKKKASVIEKAKKQELLAIFNGPSSKKILHKLMSDDNYLRELHMKSDILMVNFMIKNRKEEVFKIKPEYYSLIDPFFWMDSKTREEITQILEIVDWKITVITTQLCDLKINNPNVSFLRLSCCEILKSGKLIFKLYKNNKCLATHQNVSVSSIYFAITKSYQIVNVWGLDYSNMYRLKVDSKNKIFLEEEHSYSTRKILLEGTTIRKELTYEKRVFDGFYILDKYAAYNGVKIINWCPQSYVDVFEKADDEMHRKFV